ncbi:MAG: molybdopterin-dependent oxidoreductase [Gammaproteobacteria bacterium]|nr:molybdopterin-dependent oxidoreductase [Gammaproteobacteria bacterium]MDE0270218.1 molybdopterin-dependent oxidoreductase [Gammaproteobacteria bacterium]
MDAMLNVSRRRFLKTSGVAGGGLVFGFTLAGCSSSTPPIVRLEGDFVPNAFLQITSDSHVRFYCPRDEMGQGVSTGLATLVGEELDVAPWEMEILWAGVHADYANPEFGVQGTGGSTSIKAHYRQLRQVGANVRAVLLEAAASQLGRPVAHLATDGGHVVVDGQRIPYGQFVATAAALEPPVEAPLRRASEFKFIGKEFARIDALDKSTGAAEFGVDVDLPNLHHGVVRRCPVVGGTLQSYRADKARAVPGVTDIVEIGSGVAVVADRYWSAKKAAEALEVAWNLPELAGLGTEQLRADYLAGLDAEGDVADDRGDLEAGLAEADHVLENEYWAPYLAHAPMEPMNATVRIEGDEAEVWTGCQGIVAAQGLVARYAGIDKEKVRAHNTYLGGGFGRRATLTHVIEATQLAVATGKPIKVLWSREDDIQSGIYRPASLMRIKAGVDDAGRLTAWQAKRVGGNITPDTLRNMMPALLPGAVGEGAINWMVGLADGAFDGWVVDHSSVEGLYEDYDTANREVRHVTVNHGLPLTFWRSVGHSYTAFAKETMMDELAAKAGLDAVEFRLRNTQEKPRLHNVIQVAGERLRQWPRRAGRHLGFAAHSSFNTDVAEVAEVSVENGAIRVHEVLCVVDCGVAVNPDIVRAQMEGSVMYGLTAVLLGDLDLENGAIKQSNFHDYPILRMNEAPSVEVVIIDSAEEPTGVGEPGLPPIAPAVANAVFAATGQRLRSLPLKLA